MRTVPYHTGRAAYVLLDRVGGLTVETKVPSQNTLAGNIGGMRWRYNKLRDALTVECKAGMLAHRAPPAKDKRTVLLVREFTGREKIRDYGNLVGGAKPLIDALVTVGLLIDDSPQWCTQVYEQERGIRSMWHISFYE
jgi:hypothetical protein